MTSARVTTSLLASYVQYVYLVIVKTLLRIGVECRSVAHDSCRRIESFARLDEIRVRSTSIKLHFYRVRAFLRVCVHEFADLVSSVNCRQTELDKSRLKILRRQIPTEPNAEDVNKSLEQNEQSSRRMGRFCRRRAPRKKLCRCKPRRRRMRIRSSNPFIVFYLEMYYKCPGRHVTEVARRAGRLWCCMSDAQRRKYVCMAERERRRRRRRGARRRRRPC